MRPAELPQNLHEKSEIPLISGARGVQIRRDFLMAYFEWNLSANPISVVRSVSLKLSDS